MHSLDFLDLINALENDIRSILVLRLIEIKDFEDLVRVVWTHNSVWELFLTEFTLKHRPLVRMRSC